MTDTHRAGMTSGQLLEFIRNDQLPPDSPEPWTTMCGARWWRPVTSSIQNPNQSPNSKKRCRWSGPVCHRNQLTRLLTASHYDWTEEMHKSWWWTVWAHKVTIKHQTKCSLCYFSDSVLLCFGVNVFQLAKIAKWSPENINNLIVFLLNAAW